MPAITHSLAKRHLPRNADGSVIAAAVHPSRRFAIDPQMDGLPGTRGIAIGLLGKRVTGFGREVPTFV